MSNRKSVDKEDFDIIKELILFDICRLMLKKQQNFFSRFRYGSKYIIFLINGQTTITFVPQFLNICLLAYISLLFVSNLILYGQKIYFEICINGMIFGVC